MHSDIRATRTGLTVFNNETREIPLAGEPTTIAFAEIEERLQRVNPNWSLKRVEPALLSGPASVENLAAAARKASVDAVVVVSYPYASGNDARAGLFIHALPGIRPLIAPNSGVYLQLVSASGTRIAEANGLTYAPGEKYIETGVAGDLKELDNPDTLERVKQAVREAIRRSVKDALVRLGY